MATDAVFECATPKCAYAIDVAGLNKIQLETLRRWAKTCPKCGKRTHWQEKLPLLNTETTKNKTNGGSTNAKTINQSVPKAASQKRKAARHDGRH